MASEHRDDRAGFTLVEALAALVVAGLVISVLATMASQWFPAWNRGINRVQRAEMLGLALRRIANDLSAAEFVPSNREQPQPLFEGGELGVIFVSRAIGPNVGPGLDIVQIGETANGPDLALVRSRTPFTPLPVGVSLSETLHFSDRVVLLTPPFRLSFAYADASLAWWPDWHGVGRLPTAVRLTIHDRSRGGLAVMSRVVRIHVDAPAAECIEGERDCVSSRPDEPDSKAAFGGERSE
ncbi:prepilin-type N-terminal cleavage/methylation domain-containing protein [Bradyrhizobium sp. ERR14]|uniref:PulJ/GspJ family protein n=1 Tax=Bradyrhizobium sp. ERR14 TaxID=2663837 RepID=UPI00161F6BEC|nr:prepilin-type N-terminal cleavage/methylation domain-containing protein [Bradyrhizobium sp. ERR14]MBB4398895.1 general secretion pathway protein J [Bradyrhizobium sp. ERR14]